MGLANYVMRASTKGTIINGSRSFEFWGLSLLRYQNAWQKGSCLKSRGPFGEKSAETARDAS